MSDQFKPGIKLYGGTKLGGYRSSDTLRRTREQQKGTLSHPSDFVIDNMLEL